MKSHALDRSEGRHLCAGGWHVLSVLKNSKLTWLHERESLICFRVRRNSSCAETCPSWRWCSHGRRRNGSNWHGHLVGRRLCGSSCPRNTLPRPERYFFNLCNQATGVSLCFFGVALTRTGGWEWSLGDWCREMSDSETSGSQRLTIIGWGGCIM